jgi:hypothetical protein
VSYSNVVVASAAVPTASTITVGRPSALYATVEVTTFAVDAANGAAVSPTDTDVT